MATDWQTANRFLRFETPAYLFGTLTLSRALLPVVTFDGQACAGGIEHDRPATRRILDSVWRGLHNVS